LAETALTLIGKKGTDRIAKLHLARIIQFRRTVFREAAVSHSFFSADRPTHFKIVTVAVACSVAVTLFCLTARPNDQTKIATPAVIKAKTGIVVTSDDAKATR
jgi:hypothetical protein